MGYDSQSIEKAYEQAVSKTLEEIQKVLDDKTHSLEDKKENQTQAISGMVNQQLCKELIDMGFSKNVSEKAVFMTQNKSIQLALDYIEQHRNDPDFEEELRIVKMEEKP